MKSLFTKLFATGFIATSAVVAVGQVSEAGNTANPFGKEFVADDLTQFTKETLKKHGKLAVDEWYSSRHLTP